MAFSLIVKDADKFNIVAIDGWEAEQPETALTPNERKYKSNTKWRSKNKEKVRGYNKTHYNKYKSIKIKCDRCDIEILKRNMRRHQRSFKCMAVAQLLQVEVEKVEVEKEKKV